jgi:integrase
MAIQNYLNDSGTALWKVYVNIRSKTNPKLRAQRKVSGLKSKREAEREEMKLVRECERELAEEESKGESWGAVVLAFDEELKTNHKDSLHQTTKEDYIAALRNYTSAWWDRAAATLCRNDVKEVLNQIQAGGHTVSYQKRIRNLINRAFNFGIDSGLIRGVPSSPVVGIHLGKDQEKKPEILNISEIRRLLEAAKQLNSYWYPIWALALMTGMRNGELYSLEFKDIDWEGNSISVNKSYNGRLKVIKSTKAGYWRTVPMSSELRAFLLDLKKNAGDRKTVLKHNHHWSRGMQAVELRKFCLGLGLPSVRFHALRACFSTQLIRNGVPPIQIQKICGWKDLKTMQRYIRMAGIEIDGATEILKVLPDSVVAQKATELFGSGKEEQSA